MNKYAIFFIVLLVFILAACNASGRAETSVAEIAPNNEADGATTLEGEFALEAQLAIGSLLLEETDQAISDEQAETLLPLWQAYEALSTSGTAADIELEAIINQIEGEMSAEQVTTIQEMALSQASIQELVQNGTIRFGGLGGGDGEAGAQRGGGGGALGGGPPGGGGGQGGGVQGLDPETIQTRQAERAANGGGAGISGFTTGAVIRLLEGKTGVTQPNPQQADFILAQAFSEAMGMTVQEMRGALEEGQTYGEFAEANGDIEAVRAFLVERLAEAELPEGQTAEDVVDAFLSQGVQNRGGQRGNGNGGG